MTFHSLIYDVNLSSHLQLTTPTYNAKTSEMISQIEFERQVRPMYFNQGNIASFYRQANGWGFRSKYISG